VSHSSKYVCGHEVTDTGDHLSYSTAWVTAIVYEPQRDAYCRSTVALGHLRDDISTLLQAQSRYNQTF